VRRPLTARALRCAPGWPDGGAPAPGRRAPARRRLAHWLPLGAAVVAAGALAAPAAAGTFAVSQCQSAFGEGPAAVQADLWSVTGAGTLSTCGAPVGGALSFFAPDHRLAIYGSARAVFALPPSMPHAALRAAWLDWRSLPSVGPAFASVYAGGAVLAAGPSGGVGSPPGAAQPFVVPAGSRSLELATWCAPVNGAAWCDWSGPLLELRALTADVEDDVAPAGSASGALFGPGAHSGSEPIVLSAGDADGGVRAISLTLGGVPIASVSDACRYDRLPPCPQRLRRQVVVDTARMPDGPQQAQLAVTDAAGNRFAADLGVVLVRNQPGDPSVPPPAAFPVNPLAGRGHYPNGRPASARARVRAWLEWEGRRRRAVTVAPGVRVRIRGRVINPRGRGIAGAALALVEDYGDRRRAATGVRTRPDGRFTAFTLLGPSRTLRYAYYAYGDSRRPRLGPLLRLRVLRPSPGRQSAAAARRRRGGGGSPSPGRRRTWSTSPRTRRPRCRSGRGCPWA
jgi:hypothetical protein